jgi:hypothetical protein
VSSYIDELNNKAGYASSISKAYLDKFYEYRDELPVDSVQRNERRKCLKTKKDLL